MNPDKLKRLQDEMEGARIADEQKQAVVEAPVVEAPVVEAPVKKAPAKKKPAKKDEN